MARIAIGGFQHETNTFAPSPADYAAFVQADAWPELTAGADLLTRFAGMNIPIAGFLDEISAYGHDLVPLLWCSATPSAHVTEDAYERIADELMAGMKAGAPYDAVYLDLHGAMVTEHLEDGEGELLRRVREVVGHAVPVVASLDLHANVTEAMVAHATALIAYRTYPHVDMAATGARAARLLGRLLEGASLDARAFRKLPFLIPLTTGCTMVEPARSLYGSLDGFERGKVVSLSFTAGFAPADIAECGPAILAYGAAQEAVDAAAAAMVEAVAAAEADFVPRFYSAGDAVAHAMAAPRGPIVLADTQDNPGAGANGDTVGLLTALVRLGAQDAVLGVLWDPETAAQAHKAGEGSEIEVALGAKSGLAGEVPLRAPARVERLSDGACTGTGPFYLGARLQLGPTALLGLGGVKVVVGSTKIQAADQAMFRHLGVDPSAQKIVALKSSVHFRADFEPIAAEVLVVASPGPNPADHAALAYRRLRPDVRAMPKG